MMLNIYLKRLLLLPVFFGLASYGLSQSTITLPLYEGKAPFTKSLLQADEIGNGGRINRVAVPEITLYQPAHDNANGMAILICPGGGYRIIAIQHEGHEIAKWYQERGYTAAVLKYRLPEEALVDNSWEVPLMDAMEGIRHLRKNAQKYRIDSQKVGVLGFSAGGHLASSVSVHGGKREDGELDAQPDFSVLIYPVISMDTTITHQGSRENLLGEKIGTAWEGHFSNETQVDSLTPPAFLVHSWDDRAVPVENSIRYARALNQAEVKTELHLYEKGGHGYGRGDHDKHGNAAGWLELSDTWIKELFKQ